LRALCATRGLRINWLIVGIVKPSPSVSSPAPRPPRRTTQARLFFLPSQAGEGRKGGAKPKSRPPPPYAPPHARDRNEGAPTFRHRGPRHRRLRRGRGHALTSDSSMSEAASELHSSRPGRFANPVKRACLSTTYFQHGLPNGRSDWRSSPPAAKSARFYRRSGTKSRHRMPRRAK
jgi:hypothetical protein